MPIWMTIVLSLVGGGAIGSVLTALFTTYRNRVQPVAYGVEYQRISGAPPEESELHVQVAVTHRGQSHKYDNLAVLQLSIANNGNSDIEKFRFGVTFGEGERAIFAEAKGPDRHNTVEMPDNVISPCTPDAPKTELDFIAQPFNRRKLYEITFFVALPEGARFPMKPMLSSPNSVRFVEAPTFGEIVSEVGKNAVSIAIAQNRLLKAITLSQQERRSSV